MVDLTLIIAHCNMKKILQSLFVFLATFCFAQEDITLDQLLINSGQFTQAGLNNRVLYQRSIMYADIPHFNSGTNTATHPYFEQAILELYAASSQQYFANPSSLLNFEDVAEYASEIPSEMIS